MSATILVVDDEADILLMTRFALEAVGYTVIGAASGEEALSTFYRESPGAIILDLTLPGMDGWEVLHQLREDGALPGVPVIVASAHASPDLQRKAIELGCRAYLTKPFTLDELRRALASIFLAPDASTT